MQTMRQFVSRSLQLQGESIVHHIVPQRANHSNSVRCRFIPKHTKVRNVTNVICVRTRRFLRGILSRICSYTPIRSRTNATNAIRHSGEYHAFSHQRTETNRIFAISFPTDKSNCSSVTSTCITIRITWRHSQRRRRTFVRRAIAHSVTRAT